MSRQTLNWLLGSVCAHCECLSWTCSAFHSFSLECCLWDFDVLQKSFCSLESTLFELQSWHFDAGMIVHSTVLQDWFALCKWVHLFLWQLHICFSFIPCIIFFVHSNFALCSNIASPGLEMLFHCVYSTAAGFSEKKVDFTYNKYILTRTLEIMCRISLKTAYDRQKVWLLQNTSVKVNNIHHCKFTILQCCVTIQTWYWYLVNPQQCTL